MVNESMSEKTEMRTGRRPGSGEEEIEGGVCKATR